MPEWLNYSGFISVSKVPIMRLRCFLLGSAAVLGWGQAYADPREIHIGTGEWTPYVQEVRADAGPLGRLVKAVLESGGYRVKFFFYPWTRDEYLLQRGELDGIMPYICNAERSAYSYCSAPVVASRIVFFHHRDQSFRWQQISDLKGLRVAVTQGYAYGAQFDEARQRQLFNVIQNSAEDRGFRLLLARRADIFPQDLAVGYHMLRTQFSAEDRQNLRHSEQSVAQNTLTVLWRRDEQGRALQQLFDKGLQKLRERGDLQRLQSALNQGRAETWTVQPL